MYTWIKQKYKELESRCTHRQSVYYSFKFLNLEVFTVKFGKDKAIKLGADLL